MNLSVVTTVYNSRPFLEEFIDRVLAAISKLNISRFEIVAVIDGSPDDSLGLLLQIQKRCAQLRIVELSRNFGHHYAIVAGLTEAKGDEIFLIDCDLETAPEILLDFAKERKNGFDVVFGYQEIRRGHLVERIAGGIFWKLFNWLSDVRVPPNVVTERLMSRQYVNELLRLGDLNLFLGGMMYWVGFRQHGIPVMRKKREGRSTYTFIKRLNLLVEAITNFSSRPLRILFVAGSLLSGISLAYGFFLLGYKLIYPQQILSGFATLSVLLLFSTGAIIASLGIMGIYIGKVFRQVQRRPLYVIKEIIEPNP